MTWHWPRIRAFPALALLLVFLSVGLAQGGVIHLLLAYGGRSASVVALVNQFTGALGAWLALPVVLFVVANVAPRGSQWLRLLWLHVAGYVAFTTLHVVAIRALRWPLWAVFHVLPTNDGPLYFRVLWEAQNDLLVYSGVAALLTLLRVWQERKTSELRAAQLEAQLARAQLEVLSARLDPHFLYNALNTVNAVMHEDLARTERLLSGLGHMLRTALTPGEATWTVEEERDYVQRYIELLDARFEDRIAVEWHFEPGLDRVRVPRFAIQVLVENSAKHNLDLTNPIRVQVRAAVLRDELRITVEDDGRGFPAGTAAAVASSSAGADIRGLARLRQTLELIHGDCGRLALAASERGGARVTLEFPRVMS